jgi:hypothetical protein
MRCRPRAKGFEGNSLPIGANRNQSFEIGAQDGGPMPGQPFEHLGVRVMERIRESVRYHGKCGGDCVKKWLDAGCVAAVVTDLEHVGANRFAIGEQA